MPHVPHIQSQSLLALQVVDGCIAIAALAEPGSSQESQQLGVLDFLKSLMVEKNVLHNSHCRTFDGESHVDSLLIPIGMLPRSCTSLII